MIVAMICGSHLKLRSFDFRPDLTLNLSALPARGTNYAREVYLHPRNAHVRGNTSFRLHTVVNIQMQESVYLYYSLIAGISLALMIVVAMLKQGEERDGRGNKKN